MTVIPDQMRFADYISKWGETHALDMTCCSFFSPCWDFSLTHPIYKKKRKEQLLLVIIAISVLRLLYYFIYPDNSTCVEYQSGLWLRKLPRHKNAVTGLKSSARCSKNFLVAQW